MIQLDSGVGQNIRLWPLVSLGIRLHQKASDSLPLRNPELESRQQIKQNFQKLLESMTKRVPNFFVSYYCIRFKEVLNLLLLMRITTAYY